MKARSTLLATAVLAAVSALALTGCATGTDSGKGGSTASADASGLTLVTAGTLTVCSDIPYEPFEFMKDDKPVGFDIDIAQAVADDNKLELKVVDSSFEAITSGAFKVDCDIAASSITITDDRKKNVDFSEPYYDDDLAVIAKKDSGITSLDTAKGKNIGVQTGTTGEEYAKKNGIDTIGYEDSGLQVQSLIAGTTDASLGNLSVLGYAIRDKSDFAVVEKISTGEQLGIAVPKGNSEMLDAVNATLKSLTDSGKLDELKTKWFGN
ncbi:ABC transporter substrate-binding protein [Microbacterium gorillae]|uniref:ABC transporter substrate-binding protein n=1 Tax=Microbacterium gorillae TaxID=1231063 RepID=UPI00058B36AA|nr:ABC transporter substrate-binding protein [Microbacterium gorillae]